MWTLVLPGFVKPDRVDYLNQFIKRRTAVGDQEGDTADDADEL